MNYVKNVIVLWYLCANSFWSSVLLFDPILWLKNFVFGLPEFLKLFAALLLI